MTTRWRKNPRRCDDVTLDGLHHRYRRGSYSGTGAHNTLGEEGVNRGDHGPSDPEYPRAPSRAHRALEREVHRALEREVNRNSLRFEARREHRNP